MMILELAWFFSQPPGFSPNLAVKQVQPCDKNVLGASFSASSFKATSVFPVLSWSVRFIWNTGFPGILYQAWYEVLYHSRVGLRRYEVSFSPIILFVIGRIRWRAVQWVWLWIKISALFHFRDLGLIPPRSLTLLPPASPPYFSRVQ